MEYVVIIYRDARNPDPDAVVEGIFEATCATIEEARIIAKVAAHKATSYDTVTVYKSEVLFEELG